MIAAGFIVDEAVFSLIFFAFGCLFVLQLLVERAAKFDQRQLSQKQRLYEWKPQTKPKRQSTQFPNATTRQSMDAGIVPVNAATTSTVSPGRPSSATRGSPPSSNRVLSPSRNPQNNAKPSAAVTVAISSAPTSPNKPSEEANTTSQSTGASTDDVHAPNTRYAEANAAPHRHSSLRVGPMQWYYHRIGLVMCVLQCVRMIDPYGIHNLLPYPVIMFLQHNTIALLYSAGMIAFFFPLQLIQIVAFRRDTPWLRYVGGSLAGFAFLVANIIPIIYGTVGYYKYGRIIFNHYIILSTTIACLVFDVFVHKVAQALQGLIDFRSQSLALKPIQSPPSQRPSFSVNRHQLPQSDSARSNLSNSSDSLPLSPSAASKPTGPQPTVPTAAPLVGVAEDAASEASVSVGDSAVDSRADGRSPNRDSPTDEVRITFPSLSPHAPPASDQATGAGITREVISSSSVNTLASSGSTTSDPATSGAVSPSASNLQLITVNSSDHTSAQDSSRHDHSPVLPTRSRVGSFDSAASSSQQDTTHRFVAPSLKAESDRAVTFAASAAGPPRASITVSRRDAVAEGYKKVVQNLRRFQVLANLLVAGGVAAVIIISRRELPRANELIPAVRPDAYSSGDNLLATTVLISCGLCLLLWYSYMPMGGLCPGRVKRRSKKKSKPQEGTQAIQLESADRRAQDDRGLVSMGPLESRRPSMVDSPASVLAASS